MLDEIDVNPFVGICKNSRSLVILNQTIVFSFTL